MMRIYFDKTKLIGFNFLWNMVKEINYDIVSDFKSEYSTAKFDLLVPSLLGIFGLITLFAYSLILLLVALFKYAINIIAIIICTSINLVVTFCSLLNSIRFED